MPHPPMTAVYLANAALALAIAALALLVAEAAPRSRARRLPGGWAVVAILLYLCLEGITDIMASVGWLAEARWTVILRATVVTAYVLAWRAVLRAAYPPPDKAAAAPPPCEAPLSAAVDEMVAKVESKGET